VAKIAAGVQLFYLSRVMATSVAQIDATYGHLVPDSEEYLLCLPGQNGRRFHLKRECR
jgi:hypothetical protein